MHHFILFFESFAPAVLDGEPNAEHNPKTSDDGRGVADGRQIRQLSQLLVATVALGIISALTCAPGRTGVVVKMLRTVGLAKTGSIPRSFVEPRTADI